MKEESSDVIQLLWGVLTEVAPVGNISSALMFSLISRLGPIGEELVSAEI